ncbi:MAG TPA: 5'-3' exonuclease H3TH domain-containing protein [Dehalococcoidia bacterium]|nr:5'-3' exonuclease H3TH domain-containing protein [Dehalococcoidia bacterium]
MDVYLIDGTYELFRHYFALPAHRTARDEEVAAVRGVLAYLLSLLESGVTHIGVATDHVIESFRNDLWADYKTGAGIGPALWAQFPILEDGLRAMGVVLWQMTDLEADDGLAAAAVFAAAQPEVDRVLICSPDKDLAQMVADGRIVQRVDSRTGAIRDEAGVIERFGVPPASIADYLALVGDSSDGYPGLPGWGAKSAAALLARYGRLDAIPGDAAAWDVTVRGAEKLAATLRENRDLALLFRDLATLRTHEPALTSMEELRWLGPTPGFVDFTARVEQPALLQRAQSLARRGL